MPLACIDMDMTIADTYGRMIRRYNEKYGSNFDLNNTIQYFGDHTIIEPKLLKSRFYDIMTEDGFFLNLEPFNGVEVNLALLEASGFDIIIASRPYRESKRPYLDKLEWLEKYLPNLANKFIATSCKEYIQADVFIDDHMPFCAAYKKRNPQTKIASLLYDWTNLNIVDITGPNWYILTKNILQVFEKEIKCLL